jgi:hypothetical protein
MLKAPADDAPAELPGEEKREAMFMEGKFKLVVSGHRYPSTLPLDRIFWNMKNIYQAQFV